MMEEADKTQSRERENVKKNDFGLQVDSPRPLTVRQGIQLLLVLCVVLFSSLLIQRAVYYEAAERYETVVSVMAVSSLTAELAESVSLQEEEKSVNINTADLQELCRLEGIGSVKAQAILDYRAENGPFTYAEEIMQVDGIGQLMYEKFAHMITLE